MVQVHHMSQTTVHTSHKILNIYKYLDLGKGRIFTYLFGDIQGKHEGCGFPDEASNPPSVTDLIELSWFVGQLEQHGKSNNAL